MDLAAGIRKLTLGALAVSSFFAGAGAAAAQQVTGTLGQADATTTIKAGPATASKIRWRDQGNCAAIDAVVAAPHRAAQGCA